MAKYFYRIEYRGAGSPDPDDWKTWLEMAKFRFSTGATSAAFECINTAMKVDRDKARVRLLQDPQFKLVRESNIADVSNRFKKYIE